MSQSATLIRVAKHALDGTPLYPHHGQNTIYYQPFDLSANGASAATKYLAYTIQRAPEPRLSVATHSVKKKSLFTQFYLSPIVIENERERRAFDSFRAEQRPNSLSPLRSYQAALFCLISTEADRERERGEDEQLNLISFLCPELRWKEKKSINASCLFDERIHSISLLFSFLAINEGTHRSSLCRE